jgi:putative spermidine/putrescine transport system permease protein
MPDSARGATSKAYWSAGRGHLYLIASPALFLLVFLLGPLLRIVLRSFSVPVLAFTQYRTVLTSEAYLHTFLNTIEIAVSVTVLCLLLAYPLAFVIANARSLLRSIMLVFVLLPLWSSVVIRSFAWMIMFQRHGVLNDALMAIGLITRPLQMLQTSFAVLVGMVHILLPFMILPLVSSMRAVDQNLVRAARVLGAGPVRRFLRVYLPSTMPGIVAGCFLVFIPALGFYITPALLGGPKSTMIAVLIEQAVSIYLDWPLASALATILLVITAALYILYARLAGGEIGVSLK